MVYADHVVKMNNTTFSTKDVFVEVDVIMLMEDVFKFVQI